MVFEGPKKLADPNKPLNYSDLYIAHPTEREIEKKVKRLRSKKSEREIIEELTTWIFQEAMDHGLFCSRTKIRNFCQNYLSKNTGELTYY